MRPATAIVVLLFIALVVATAVLLQLVAVPAWESCDDDIYFGFAVGQVQLFAAALVFLRRGLWLRIAALACCICFWSTLLRTESIADPRLALQTALLFMAAAILTAVWCGAQIYLGWRLVVNELPPFDRDVRRQQFSLATLLLAITVAGTWLGLWKNTVADARDWLTVVVVLVFSLGGCTALKATADGNWRWVPLVAVLAGSGVASVWAWGPSSIFGYGLGSLLRVFLVQLSLLVLTMVTLRVAGIRLVRETTSAQHEHGLPLESALNRYSPALSSPRSFTSS